MAEGGADLLLHISCCLGYVWCASRFLTRHLQGRPQEGRAFGVLLFCVQGSMALLSERGGLPYFFYALCGHVLRVGLVMALFRAQTEKKLLAAALLEVMTKLLWDFSESFFCCVGLLAACLGASGLWQAAGSFWQAVSRSWGMADGMDLWTEGAVQCLTCAAGIMGIFWLSGPLASVFADKKKSWYLMLTVPLAIIVLLTDLVDQAASNGIVFHSWGGYELYEEQLLSHSAMCLFTGLEMAVAGSFVFGMDRICREEREREQYRSQVQYYQMMEEQYGQMERLRHDMKNHLLALENLVQERQWEQAGRYLRELTKAGSVETGEEATGSLVLDALLYHKRRQAAAQGIGWQCDARLPSDCPIQDMDLCIIVGNTLDNAVEACVRLQKMEAAEGNSKESAKGSGKEPFIRVYVGAVKRCLFLEVQNSTDLADIRETWRSRKEEPGLHGLGLSNVQAVADAYDGTVHVEVEDGVFTLSVLLPMRR